uniref:Uncharacterized protein n=1 Tax=Arundo donax TaxID=35708 RepID=A0A0A9EUC1_ARUDO
MDPRLKPDCKITFKGRLNYSEMLTLGESRSSFLHMKLKARPG